MVQKLLFLSLMLSALLVLFLSGSGCRHEAIIPDHTVCFQSEVHPVIISRCAMPGCHSASGQEEDVHSYVTYTDIMTGVTPGKPYESEIYKAFVHHSHEVSISEPTSYEKAIVKLWIRQGAVNDTACQ